MRGLLNLELHVTHACNLTCESCSHYSNQGHKGMLSLEEAEQWMKPWAGRLEPQVFSLLGGEPTIHPRLPEFLPLVRRHWPRTHLRIVTNGFFLHLHPTLPEVMRFDPSAALYLSIHHESKEYLEKLRPALVLLERWRREFGIDVRNYRSAQSWTRRYKGFGAAMEPFDDHQPRQSWERCPAKYCPQLFNGQIWKCAPLAYLNLQNARHGLSAKWTPYFGYAPLSPDCSDEQLNAFFDRQEESYCGMCPADPQPFQILLPLRGRESEPDA